MAATALERAEWAYHQADMLDSHHYPYVFGGGHPTPHLPWVKLSSKTLQVVPASGPDCSGGVSNILWHAGVLESPTTAKGTLELAHWGSPGKGEHITVWVINTASIQHCVLRFTLPNKPHGWWAATHTGGTVGWQNYDGWDPASVGYIPRHPKLP